MAPAYSCLIVLLYRPTYVSYQLYKKRCIVEELHLICVEVLDLSGNGITHSHKELESITVKVRTRTKGPVSLRCTELSGSQAM